MYRFSKAIYFTALFLFILLSSSFAQNKSVGKKKITDFINFMDESGKKLEFVFKSNPKFELQNGMLNISVLSGNNTLLEITGINENEVKDTVLGDNSFKMMYIISQNEKAFISKVAISESVLKIKCSKMKKGNPITISLKGKLFRDGKFIEIDAKLNGLIPEIRNTTTRKIN